MIAGGVGLILGVSALMFSPQLPLIILATVGVTLAALKRPEIALFGILTATSSIIFEEMLPLLNIGIGSLHVPDLILLTSLGVILIRWLVENNYKIIRTPLDLPLLVFYSMALLSTFVAVSQSSVEFEDARRAIREITYYMTFFVVTNLVREERQLHLLVRGFFLLATIVAVVMIAQYLVGESVHLLPGYVGTLQVSGKLYSGAIRVVPPGRSLILVSFITLISMLSIEKLTLRSIFIFIQWLLLGLALLLTFLRSFWVVIGVALLILAHLTKGQNRTRLIGWGLAVIIVISLVVLIAFNSPDSPAAKLLRGSFARLRTLATAQTLEESSLQWRYVENEYALAQIISHPLLGLGLGAQYRPFDPRLDFRGMGWDARGYIHNGHLWILMTTGFLGYISLMWLSIVSIIRGFRYWRHITDFQMRGIVLGFTLAYLGIIIAGIVNSVFVSWIWIPVIGIMMGINEVILRKVLLETLMVNQPNNNGLVKLSQDASSC
jgi:hypothetical protein